MNAEVFKPLKSVVGMQLLSIDYWLLQYNIDGFIVDEPNRSGGCQAVDLFFDRGMVEINWGADQDQVAKRLGYAYHIVASSTPAYESNIELQNLGSASWKKLSVNSSAQWQAVLGEPLQKVLVHGVIQSPQAVEFVFPSGEVIISIGDTSNIGRIGDGDEILVFSKHDWEKTIATQSFSLEAFQTLWQMPNNRIS